MENVNEKFEYQFSEEEIKQLEERSAKRESGESEIFSWQKAKEIILGHRSH